MEPRSPTLQVDSLPAEKQGKAKNTGVGSLLLFQRIFPPQESNWGLLHCRRILYLLNYRGSPQDSLSLIIVLAPATLFTYNGSYKLLCNIYLLLFLKSKSFV